MVLHQVARTQVQQVKASPRVQALLLLVQASDQTSARGQLGADARQADDPSHTRPRDRGGDRDAARLPSQAGAAHRTDLPDSVAAALPVVASS